MNGDLFTKMVTGHELSVFHRVALVPGNFRAAAVAAVFSTARHDHHSNFHLAITAPTPASDKLDKSCGADEASRMGLGRR